MLKSKIACDNDTFTDDTSVGLCVCVCLAHLQDDIGAGQTASPAGADLHVVKPTVSLGDVLDLHIAPTLWHGLIWQNKREQGGKEKTVD